MVWHPTLFMPQNISEIIESAFNYGGQMSTLSERERTKLSLKRAAVYKVEKEARMQR